MFVMVALVCGPVLCRDVPLPIDPLPRALCQMQAMQTQAFVAEMQARKMIGPNEQLRRVYCVPPGVLL